MEKQNIEYDYTNRDALLYLINHASGCLDAAIKEICGVSTGNMVGVEDLPPHLETAVSILDGVGNQLLREKEKPHLRGIRNYSNGVPVEYVYKGEPVTDPEGNTYRPECVTNVRPSGRIDVPIPADQEPWWW
ncbi:hypothetical protein [Corynebacterium kroppenstedtii]|uniref:hypothetical protein n=1 Tax=Corynebacterium kroppenstedtii TaxID=161879 RepID=UPI0019599C19|nr:hypothetical protein [Corynebacterium kroppenstedtii]QRQ64972.1 hypothetical protein I6J23_00170 [Corynebacterium kroppenstedtii]